MLFFPIKSRLQILKSRNNIEKTYYGNYFTILVSPIKENDLKPKIRVNNYIRYLIVITKKIHKTAVVRNKFKRRIKEAFKKIDKSLLKNKYDYQLIVKDTIFEAKLTDIIKDIEDTLSDKVVLKKVLKKKKKCNNMKTIIALNKNKEKNE